MKACFAFVGVPVLFVLAPLASARIGWDEDTAIKYYGKPIAAEPDERTFLKDGWFITMVFSKGKCAEIYYAKFEGEPISKEEAKALMEKNGKGWKRDDLNSMRVKAEFFDNDKAFVIHRKTSVTIELWSHFEADRKRREQEVKEQLSGL